MKTIQLLVLICVCTLSHAQITFNGCHPLFDDQDFYFTHISTDVTGRHIYETVPISGDQSCGGIGVCEFRISWNDSQNRWEFIADDGTGDFSSAYLIYYNTEPSIPNPPSLQLGVWVENTSDTTGLCGGQLTTGNANLTGDVQDFTLGIKNFTNANQVVNIFPNPTDDLLNIGYDQIPPSEVLIYDISGKLVFKTNKHSNIDVSTYAPGVYFVKIIIESQERVGKLIVK